MKVPFTLRSNDFSEHGVSMVRFGERRPLLEVELNEVQQNFNKKVAEILKQSAYSGFLKLNDLGGYASKEKLESLNTMYLTDYQDKIDVVNLDGFIINLRNSEGHGNIKIPLPEPPESGVEDNLVFLEFWYADVANNSPIYRYGNIDNEIETYFSFDPRIGVETTRRTQLRYRIRVEKHVDFASHQKGLTDARVRGWGESNTKNLSEYGFTPTPHDPMLFRSGNGTDQDIEFFKTVDGFVYAIPLFKVSRRNQSGFTAKNPNGGISLASMSDRPDGLFANIIDSNDITDLRNSISLTGYNYQKLLSHEFDRFLRAENGKKSLSKTYHGIPKTPVTINTIFYADLDGTTEAVYALPIDDDYAVATTTTNLQRSTVATYLPTPTGLGAIIKNATTARVNLLNFNKDEGEISFLIDFDMVNRFEKVAYLTLLDANDEPVIQIFSNGRHLTAEIKGAEDLKHQSFEGGFHYVTLCWKKGEGGTIGEANLYIDGQQKDSRGYTPEGDPATKLLLGYYKVSGSFQYNESIVMSDVHISNKCTLSFGSMPSDFREGYAKITPKFSGQRRLFGDGQISQNTVGRVRASGNENSAGITKEQRTSGTWSVNDVIVIKGLGGEIISGVVDASELKIRIRESTELDTPSPIVKVVDTTNLSVSKKIRIWNMNLNEVSNTYTIVSVDVNNSTVTLNSPVSVEIGSYIINETFVNRVPVVKAEKSLSEIVDMPGTWTGLGTQEAVFRFTSIPTGCETKDLVVQYSLNTPSQQKGLLDNLETIYEAEINGELLFPRSTFTIIDDLKDKIMGNLTNNPNTMKFLSKTSLGNLANFVESVQFSYTAVGTLNGEATTTESAVPNEIPQRLFTFDLVKIIEKKFGKEIPDTNKLDWIKSNLEAIRFNWYGFGTSHEDTKASIGVFNHEIANWNTYTSHSYDHIEPLSIFIQSFNYDKIIDTQGIVNFIAYGGKALNAEQTATLYTDYVSIELVLRGRDKFSFLVPVKEEVRKIHLDNPVPPENPNEASDPLSYRFKPFQDREIGRRDILTPNLILFQKNTKRIELLFEADNDTQVVTYGSHIPRLEPLDSIEEVTILTEDKTVLLTDLSTEFSGGYESHHWKDPLYRVRNESRSLGTGIGFKEVPFTADSLNVNVGALITVNGQGPVNYFTRQYAQMDSAVQAVAIAKYLVVHKGEIKLLICSLHPDGKIIDLDYSEVALLVPITGNPIVKEIDGIKRTDQLPTAWRTSLGNLRGYYDEYGTFIATYQ